MKILLVEDDRSIQEVLKEVFKLNNIDCESAYDGLEALEYLDYQNYDVVILDVMMPKLDGFGVLKAMRDKKNTTPVLMLTAKSEIDDKVLGLDLGADDYLSKPFIMKELLARIRALARRNTTIIEPYNIGNITLNPNTYEMSANSTVKLTNKEFGIMELLIKNKNNFLTPETMLDEVWGMEAEADINVLWVFMSSLRKKLEQIGASHKIKATRGVGYKLEVIQ